MYRNRRILTKDPQVSNSEFRDAWTRRMGPPDEHVGRIKGKSKSESPRIGDSDVGRNAGRPAQRHTFFMPLYLRAVSERENPI